LRKDCEGDQKGLSTKKKSQTTLVWQSYSKEKGDLLFREHFGIEDKGFQFEHLFFLSLHGWGEYSFRASTKNSSLYLEPELSKFPSKDYSFVDQKMLRHLSSYVVSPNGVPISRSIHHLFHNAISSYPLEAFVKLGY
jgi:hypothetical protein